jgi:hypothetical protein
VEIHPLSRTKVEYVTDAPYLAELSAANPGARTSECLSVFLSRGETAAECLSDPAIVGEVAAPGHWRLLGVDEGRRRAYYARIEHSQRFRCAGRSRVRGTYIYPPIS